MTAYAALAEPHRRQILDLLRGGERTVGDLVERLELSQPGVSKHLRVLREASLVAVRPDGRRRLYALSPQPLAEVDAWLEPYRAFWSSRLDALERHLEENPQCPAPLSRSTAVPRSASSGGCATRSTAYGVP